MQRTLKIMVVLLGTILMIGCSGEDSLVNNKKTGNVAEEGGSNDSNSSDDPLDVLERWLKAEQQRDLEEAAPCISKASRSKVKKHIDELEEMADEIRSDVMNEYVNYAQKKFNDAVDYDDESESAVIDASYLYDDKDLKKAIDIWVDSLFEKGFTYKILSGVEKISDDEVTVTVEYTVRDIWENNDDFYKRALDNLSGKMMDKLVNNSNFIKQEIAKKVMKEYLIDSLDRDRDSLNRDLDVLETRKEIYRLKKEYGGWVIVNSKNVEK